MLSAPPQTAPLDADPLSEEPESGVGISVQSQHSDVGVQVSQQLQNVSVQTTQSKKSARIQVRPKTFSIGNNVTLILINKIYLFFFITQGVQVSSTSTKVKDVGVQCNFPCTH